MSPEDRVKIPFLQKSTKKVFPFSPKADILKALKTTGMSRIPTTYRPDMGKDDSMHYETFDISVDYGRAGVTGTGNPRLYAYLRDPSPEMAPPPRPAIVICPGGGYYGTSDREAEPIALRFLAMGFQCFVLRYTTVGQSSFPGSLLELAASVALVRGRAAEWNIDPNRIVVMGFSAGGHLAASLGVFWNREFVTAPLGLKSEDIRPNGMLLGYPVITSGEHAHRDSFINLLGDRYEENLALVSLENQVSADTPPTFLWHTWEDTCVPVENSLLFAGALRRSGVPLEMHILPWGCHGLSLATAETNIAVDSCKNWPEWAERWIREL